MAITDELREWASQNIFLRAKFEELTIIADHIDVAHEHGMEERADRYSELRAKMNNCYIELPKDADGEYIHVGDVMEWPDGFDEPFEVVGIGADTLYYMYDDSCEWTQASTKRHHKQPTVEDLLREMLDAWGEMPSNMTNEVIVAEYAAKLRGLAGDAE